MEVLGNVEYYIRFVFQKDYYYRYRNWFRIIRYWVQRKKNIFILY